MLQEVPSCPFLVSNNLFLATVLTSVTVDRLCLFLNLTQMELDSRSSFEYEFFCPTYLRLPMLMHILVVFLILSSFLLCRCKIIYLFILLLTKVWIISGVWLLWIKLLQLLLSKFFGRHLCSFLMDIDPAGSQGRCMFNLIRGYRTVFQSGCVLYILPGNVCEFSCSTPL